MYRALGSLESGSWQHNKEGPWRSGLFSLQTSQNSRLPKILLKHSLHLSALGLKVTYYILPSPRQAMKASPETRHTWSLGVDTYLKPHLSSQIERVKKQGRKQQTLEVKQFPQCCPNSPFHVQRVHCWYSAITERCFGIAIAGCNDKPTEPDLQMVPRFRLARWCHSPPSQKGSIHGIKTATVSHGAEGRCIGTGRESPKRGKSSFAATNKSLPHAMRCH